MRLCLDCGASLPEHASFCGKCGKVLPMVERLPTSALPLAEKHDVDAAPALPPSPSLATTAYPLPDGATSPALANDWRQPHSVGGGLPTQPFVLPAPDMFQRPPVFLPPQLSNIQQERVSGKIQSYKAPKKRSGTRFFTCLTVTLVTLLVLLIGALGLGFTVWAPVLTIQNRDTFAANDQLHVHGIHFIPFDTVVLLLDNTISLADQQEPSALFFAHQPSLTAFASLSGIKVANNGTFDASITVSPDWRPGLHSLKALENFSPRQAALTFTIATPAAPPQPGVDATPTAQAVSTSTPTTTDTHLNAIQPAIVALGPVSEQAPQTLLTQILLTTTGHDLLSWNATWNQAQAPWLQVEQVNGQIQAPQSQTVTLNVHTDNLKAGTYTTTISFLNTANQQAVTVQVTVTIQAGCVPLTATTLTFVSTMTTTPAAQTVTLTNCGPNGNWTTNVDSQQTNWLNVSPANGQLDQNRTQAVSINVMQQSAPATFQTTLIFSINNNQVPLQIQYIIVAS